MSLQNWLNNGWLAEHRTSSQEIAALLEVADRDLLDCKTSGLSPDWQLNIAYNAALAASGYRAAREAHHYRVIQSLAYTIKADAGLISDQEAKEMVDLANCLRQEVEEWLHENHMDLMEE